MRIYHFAKRNFKEIIRDPLSIIFALLLPLFLLFIFRQFEIPNEVYNIENFTPGILVFGFSFLSMFTASLVAKDRSSSLLTRLGVSPMRGFEFVGGYALSILPLVAIQMLLFFTAALLLGLPLSIGVLATVAAAFPISILFIAIGILIGSFTGEKSAAGVSSVVVQLVAFTGGMYFDGEMVGDFFSTVCRILPFSSAVDIFKALLQGNAEVPTQQILTLLGYTVVLCAVTVAVFRRNMFRKN